MLQFNLLCLFSAYKYSARTFMFNNENGKLKKIEVKNSEKAVCYHSDHGPCFGEGVLVYSQPGILSLPAGKLQRKMHRTVSLNDAEVFYQVKN